MEAQIFAGYNRGFPPGESVVSAIITCYEEKKFLIKRTKSCTMHIGSPVALFSCNQIGVQKKPCCCIEFRVRKKYLLKVLHTFFVHSFHSPSRRLFILFEMMMPEPSFFLQRRPLLYDLCIKY